MDRIRLNILYDNIVNVTEVWVSWDKQDSLCYEINHDKKPRYVKFENEEEDLFYRNLIQKLIK